MQREYVFKCPRWNQRILGVSVVDPAREITATPTTTRAAAHQRDNASMPSVNHLASSCRIYILTSEPKIHVLEVTRRSASKLKLVRAEKFTRKRRKARKQQE